MTARKLTDSEKKTILNLYRTTGETSSTLAQRYGVSTSTISRILKSTLPPDEYEALIQQKRSVRTVDVAVDTELPEPNDSSMVETEPTIETEATANTETAVEEAVAAPKSVPAPVLRRSRKRTSVGVEDSSEESPRQLEVPLLETTDEIPVTTSQATHSSAEAEVLKEILSQNLIEPDEDLSDELDEELDEDLDEEDEEDEDFDDNADNGPLLVSGRLKEGFLIQILPLAEAPIPRTCYLVVDRAAELIAPPLREFGDLGQIPEAEVQQKTLPIFDNHRVAKRYSNPRTQRVIKLPDGRVLSKTSSHLQAKGITRLLIDGRVYSLT